MKKTWQQYKAEVNQCAQKFEQNQNMTLLHLWAATLEEAETYVTQQKEKKPFFKRKSHKETIKALENDLASLTRTHNSAKRKFEESQTIYTRLPTLPPREHLGTSLLPPGPTQQEKSFKDYGYEKEKNFWCCCKFFGKPQPKKPNSDEEGLSYTQLVNR